MSTGKEIPLSDTGIVMTSGAGRQLLTAEEVAEMLGMTVQWVWDQSRKGTIPTITLGRKKRYRREAIEQWLRELEGASAR